jgi:hypothetical protein
MNERKPEGGEHEIRSDAMLIDSYFMTSHLLLGFWRMDEDHRAEERKI